MIRRSIDRVVAAYKLSDLQTFRNIIMDLERSGYSIDKLLKYIRIRTELAIPIPSRLCPSCGYLMSLHPVNDTSCNQVGGKFKSHFFCARCGESIFSKKTVEKEQKKLLKKQIDFFKKEREEAEFDVKMWGIEPLHRRCSECGKKQYLYPINIPPGPKNKYGYKCLWQCTNCGNEDYKKHSTKEEIVRLRRI